jgi:glycopeptide antibiotics resistance protein
MANLQEYFRYGTFDIGDLVAGLLGALAAFMVAEFIRDPFLREWQSHRF